MAKKSKIAKNEKRKEIVARYAARRQELKAIIKNPNTPDEERLDAQFELNRQPRDASPCRIRNRDACPVSASAKWLTAVSFRVFVSPAGKREL